MNRVPWNWWLMTWFGPISPRSSSWTNKKCPTPDWHQTVSGNELFPPSNIVHRQWIRTLTMYLWFFIYPLTLYYWTGPLILDHSLLVGKLTSSKIADTSVRILDVLKLLFWSAIFELVKSQRVMSGPILGDLSNNRMSGGNEWPSSNSIFFMCSKRWLWTQYWARRNSEVP